MIDLTTAAIPARGLVALPNVRRLPERLVILAAGVGGISPRGGG